MLGKSRGIQNYQIILFRWIGEEIGGIHGKSLVQRCSRKIQFHVFPRKVHCPGRCIHCMHQFCSSLQGIDRKSSRITEHIQHFPAFGIGAEQLSVFPLINKETSFLSFPKINPEPVAILHSNAICCIPENKTVLYVSARLERDGTFTLVIHRPYFQSGDFNQIFKDQVNIPVHPCRMHLHHQDPGIMVHDQSGKPVPFRIDKPENISDFRAKQPCLPAKSHRLPYLGRINFLRRPFFFKTENPYRD